MRFMREVTTSTMMLVTIMLLAVLAGCGGYGSPTPVDTPTPPPPVQKIKIDSLDDLPAHSYPLTGTVSELLDDPAALDALKTAYKADLESDLATYEITDDATLQGKYQSLAVLAMLDGQDDQAIVWLDKARALEDKEAARLMQAMTTRSLVAARKTAGPGADQDAVLAAFETELRTRATALPWETVQDNIKAAKGRAEFMSETLLRGVVQARMDPAAAQMGGLSADLAGGVLGISHTIDNMLVLNPVVAEVYSDLIAANDVQKADIWEEREFTLTGEEGLDPMVVAIWDSGVDVDVYGDAMWVNKFETLDGTDTDGNGFVDDLHGIAFDLDGVADVRMLHPLGDQEGQLEEVFQYMQGFQDLTSAVDSEDAAAVRKKLSSMPSEEVGGMLTTMGFGGLYMHGTHVAGIASRGNPFARLLNARITFDYHTTPQAMTHDTARRMADGYVATTKYFAAAGVRCTNMSWGWTFKEIEGGLEANGVGEDAEERAKLAREMIDILADGLRRSMEQAPEILFVTAAGNDDNDVEFDVVIPSSFDLPNLMVIGAVDQAGDPTGFTSGGRLVKVYANGFQVPSYVPGGRTMKMSGTSMASPNVCNTAAKLFTLDPSLTAVQVRELIEQGADPNADHPDILLLNPMESVKLLKQEASTLK